MSHDMGVPLSGDALRPLRELDEVTALGALVSVCIRMGAYQDWTIASLDRFFLPPIQLGQYVVFTDETGPQGFVTWSWLSDPAIAWILTRHDDPRPYEWRSGPNPLIMDVVCRPGLGPTMARHMQRSILVPGSPDYLHDFDHAQALKRDTTGQVIKISRWPRRNAFVRAN